MLATKLRFTQTQDPTGVAGATCGATVAEPVSGPVSGPITRPVTAPAYPVNSTIPSSLATRLAPVTADSFTADSFTAWTVIDRMGMGKVDFHDRWPLYSTS